MLRGVLLGVVGAAVLAACAPTRAGAPIQMVKGADGWQSIAEETAGVLATPLADRPMPVYVAEMKNPSVFGKAFTGLLKSALVTKSVPVSDKPEGASTLTCTALSVSHDTGAPDALPPGPRELVLSCFVSEADRCVATAQAVYHFPAGDAPLYQTQRVVKVMGQ